MSCLLQGFVKGKNHGRQHRDAGDDAEQDALCHHKAHIQAERKAHEAQGDEARDGRDGGADDGTEGVVHGLRHRGLLVLLRRQVVLIAVPEKDRVVHRNAQLQDCSDGLCDVGDLAQEQVGAHVVEDSVADGEQEDEGHQVGVHRQGQDDNGQEHGDADVDRRLSVGELLRVHETRCHAAQKALRAADLPDLFYGLHGAVLRGPVVKDDEHQRGIALVEGVIDVLRQNLLRNGQVQDGVVPDHVLDVGHVLDFCLEVCDLLVGHAVHLERRKSSRSELRLQDVLSLHRVDVLGQVHQHVVVDSGGLVSDHGGNQEDCRKDQDRDAQFNDFFTQLFHALLPGNGSNL